MADTETKADDRGEITLPLAGVEYHLRPSYAAIKACEDATGMSLFELAAAAGSKQLSVAQLAVISVEMMKAWGRANPDDPQVTTHRAVSAETLAEMIFEEGPIKVLPRVAVLLAVALTGGVTSSGELKAPKA